MLRTRLIVALLSWGLALGTAAQLNAQCDRVGWVVGALPGCGMRIIDLDNGELLLATSGINGLTGGQTISFSAEYVETPAACSLLGWPSAALTCVSSTLPCQADFNYVVDNLNPYQFAFDADVYGGNQQCTWSFSDGSTANGAHIVHTFPFEAYYTVCLTVSDGAGCTIETCKEVFVSAQNPGWCGYDMELTAIDTRLYGKVQAIGSNNGALAEVQWFNSATNEIIGATPEIEYELPDYGNYLICAQYQVNSPNGTPCANTLCRQLTVAANGCVNPQLQNPNAVCAPVYAPVCGCDGITYGNECEAMSAGVSAWWAGSCSSIGFGNCSAAFDIEVVSGNPNIGYWVKFTNLSTGAFNQTQLDFGDGSIPSESSQWNTQTHHYAKGGIYKANLSVWKNNNCVQSLTKLIITDAVSMDAGLTPGSTDYVLPGDANGDARANMYDLLSIGLAYNEIGAPRPNASVAWEPQFAPNWGSNTNWGLNKKHIDCDGNGIVNEFDPAAVQQNYIPLDTTEVVWNPGAPTVRVQFAQDTLYVDPSNPQTMQISADLIVGGPQKPVLGMYGLALALQYPQFANHDPVANYDDGSFFGFSNYLLWLPQDNYSRRQLDLGFTHKQGNGASGYGRIASLNFQADFIIIIDIVDRAPNHVEPFTLPIKGVKAVDAYGNKMDLSVPFEQDTLWIKMVQTSGTSSQSQLAQQVQVYPNPASDAVYVYTGDLRPDWIEIRNPVGQSIRRVDEGLNRFQRLEIGDWPAGLYTVCVHTREGSVEKKLVVH